MQLNWVEELKVRFVSGENVIFLLHGSALEKNASFTPVFEFSVASEKTLLTALQVGQVSSFCIDRP